MSAPIILDVEQGSPAWEAARLGVVTASQAHRIVTPTGKLSSQREEYVAELLYEWATGEPFEEFGGTHHTERGKALEPLARAHLKFVTGEDVREAGFVYKDESRMVGCSPDALIGYDGGAELKCPGPGKHLVYWHRGVVPKAYVPQVQFSMWVTGREWWMFQSFHPELPHLLLRVERDAAWMEAFDAHVPAVLDEIRAGRERLRAEGFGPSE